jgi:hypothetical protein
MTNNKELLLVHASMNNVKLEHTVNVMLTPQFYTLKKEAIPAKYAYQAKKIASSLFDGLLEEDGEYEYVVFKEKVNDEEQWVFIAYNVEKVTDFLESKGMDLDKVAKVFFAQQSLEQFRQAPLGLGEYDAMTVIEDIVVVVPRVVLGEGNIPSLHFTNALTPQTGGVGIKNKPTEQSTLMTQTQAYSLAAIFLLFAGMFVVEGSRYAGDVDVEKQEIESIYASHAYLRSSYTRQDAIDKYQSIDKKERRKRDAIKIVSSMMFKGVNLTKLKVDEKKFTSEFECADTTVSKRVKSLASKAKDGFLSAKGDRTVTLEGTL